MIIYGHISLPNTENCCFKKKQKNNTALILLLKMFLGVIFNIFLHTCFRSM